MGGPPVSLDGIIGANTLNAINSINPFTLYNTFKARLKEKLHRSIAKIIKGIKIGNVFFAVINLLIQSA